MLIRELIEPRKPSGEVTQVERINMGGIMITGHTTLR